MDFQWWDGDSEARFGAYFEELSRLMGHADRVEPLRSYCTGLLLPGKRKSVKPMAARLRPDRTSAEHQSLLHFSGSRRGTRLRCCGRCERWSCRC